MLQCIGASLYEILHVKGSALLEIELWALLRSICQVAQDECPNESKCFMSRNALFEN